MDNYTEEEALKKVKEAGGSAGVFNEWMRGQTCPFVDGKPGYYAYDVDRFIRYKCNPKNEPVDEFD